MVFKLFSKGDEELKAMAKVTQKFFTAVGLKINHKKLAIKIQVPRNYGGSTSKLTRKCYGKIKTEMLTQVEWLCNRRLKRNFLIEVVVGTWHISPLYSLLNMNCKTVTTPILRMTGNRLDINKFILESDKSIEQIYGESDQLLCRACQFRTVRFQNTR
ncbi:hypothetical protein PAEPH01_2835 [Pancytospora epiphaga]|nr:hypothetical protein PAEPH01_2835 [Pancytospora epiphaga]